MFFYNLEQAGLEIIRALKEDVNRQGLKDTPKRFSEACKEWFSGYEEDPEKILKTFEDGAENYDQLITVKNIPFYSHCEHHLAPFFGTVTIGYIPNKKIVGLSKLPRLVNIFSRRLQVQERLTVQIADAINENLEPQGVGVFVKARHLCMESRGICQQGTETITTSLRGILLTDLAAKSEFIEVCK